MSRVLHPVVSVDHLLHLDPLDRLQMQIAGDNFDPCLREEPITFDIHDPISDTAAEYRAARSTAPRRHGGATDIRRNAWRCCAAVPEKHTG